MRPVASSTTTPQTWVVFERTPRCDGLTGFVPQAGQSTRLRPDGSGRGVDDSDAVGVPGAVHVGADQEVVVDREVARSPVALVPSEFGVRNSPICTAPPDRSSRRPACSHSPSRCPVPRPCRSPRPPRRAAAGLVELGRVGVPIGIRRIDRPPDVHRRRRVRQVERNEATVPVRQEDDVPSAGRLGTMAVVRVGVASLAAVERASDVLDPPVGHLERDARVGDVDQPEVAVAIGVAVAARRRLGIAAGRDRRVRKGSAEIGAVLDLELVHAAGTAGRSGGTRARPVPPDR